MVPETDSRVDGRTMSGALVTGNFFQVLGVGAAQGRVLTPADDDARHPVVVLSDRGRSTYFPNDPVVVGRSLLLNGVRYDVVGVMPKGFRGLLVGPPDYWAPLSMIEQLQPALVARNKDIEVAIVGRLRPGMTRGVALAQLLAWDSRRTEGIVERGGATITLQPRQGTIPQPMEAVLIFTPLFITFGLILLIGCANVASLLLARAVSRQREVGIRLSLGASRGQVVRQLLTESLILALAAAVLGYGISRLILEGTIWAVLSTMPPDIGDVRLLVPDGDWRVGAFLFAGAIVASVLFGLAPAMQATRIELVRTMRGEITRDARPGRMRNVLIGVQVTASALLLISCRCLSAQRFRIRKHRSRLPDERHGVHSGGQRATAPANRRRGHARPVGRLACGIAARSGFRSRGRRWPRAHRTRRRQRTGSSRRNISARSGSTSFADERSRPQKTAWLPAWRSWPRALRNSYGPAATRLARRCGSRPIQPSHQRRESAAGIGQFHDRWDRTRRPRIPLCRGQTERRLRANQRPATPRRP